MFAKITVHGTGRTGACRRLVHALGDCLLLGLPANRAFSRDYVAHPTFPFSGVPAMFIDRHFPTTMRQAAVPDAAVCQATTVLLAYLRQDIARRYPVGLHDWASSRAYPTLCRFMSDGEAIDMYVHALGARQWKLVRDGGATQVAVVLAGDGRITFMLGDVFHTVGYAVTVSACHFMLDGIEHTAIDTTYVKAGRSGTQTSSGRISAPMNGRVVAAHAAEDEAVCAGQVLLVIGAMKMEHSIAAPLAGEVRGLFTQVDALVASGGLLMEITAAWRLHCRPDPSFCRAVRTVNVVNAVHRRRPMSEATSDTVLEANLLNRVTLGDTLYRGTHKFGAKAVLVDSARRMTHGELNTDNNRYAHALPVSSLEPGDKVTMVCGNSAQFPVATYGILKAGLAWVSISAMLGPEDTCYILERAETRHVMVNAALYPVLCDTLAALGLPAYQCFGEPVTDRP